MNIFAFATPDQPSVMPAPPATPPEPRAPAVLAHLEASKALLSTLDQEIAGAALAAAEGKPGGNEKLHALHQKISAAQFAIDCNARAHELAIRLDRQAVVDWKVAIQALPADQIVTGITATTCCKLCSDTTGCVISGGACAHPVMAGSLSLGLQGDPAVRRVYRAAREECDQ